MEVYSQPQGAWFWLPGQGPNPNTGLTVPVAQTPAPVGFARSPPHRPAPLNLQPGKPFGNVVLGGSASTMPDPASTPPKPAAGDGEMVARMLLAMQSGSPAGLATTRPGVDTTPGNPSGGFTFGAPRQSPVTPESGQVGAFAYAPVKKMLALPLHEDAAEDNTDDDDDDDYDRVNPGLNGTYFSFNNKAKANLNLDFGRAATAPYSGGGSPYSDGGSPYSGGGSPYSWPDRPQSAPPFMDAGAAAIVSLSLMGGGKGPRRRRHSEMPERFRSLGGGSSDVRQASERAAPPAVGKKRRPSTTAAARKKAAAALAAISRPGSASPVMSPSTTTVIEVVPPVKAINKHPVIGDAAAIDYDGPATGLVGITGGPENQLSCHVCTRQFENRAAAKIHITACSKKSLRCRHCARRFTSQLNLDRHEQTHTEKKRHTCSYCPKKFTGRSETKEHERTHTGEKPYACSYCDMRFTQGGNMRRHERVHTGEKRFGCKYCPMKFSQRNNAINHEDKKHGNKAPQ